MRSSNIGGQAVLEGIMMRNGGRVLCGSHESRTGRSKSDSPAVSKVSFRGRAPLKIPFIRGIFNFVDSLVLGMKTLTVFSYVF